MGHAAELWQSMGQLLITAVLLVVVFVPPMLHHTRKGGE
jgi:hypothetical protein